MVTASGAVVPLGSAEYTASAPSFRAGIVTSVGRYLSPEDPGTSLTVEPEVQEAFSGGRALEFAALFNLPFDEYREVSTPKIRTSLTQQLSAGSYLTTALTLSAVALDVDRWSLDGHRFRGILTGKIIYEPFRGLTLRFAAGPFYQWNAYTQRADGRDLTYTGLVETFRIAYRTGPVELEAVLSVEQGKSSVWRNEYGTQERAAFYFTEKIAAGLRHELLAGVVDESTGFYRPLSVLDGRESRVSAFLEWKL